MRKETDKEMIDTSDYSLSDSNKKKTGITDVIFQNNFWRWFTYLSLLSLGGGISYAWYFATEKLNPLIEQSLSNYLSRPVKLGDIEFISLNTIRLGKSAIETTPTENDSAIVEEVVINFNPFNLLSRQLELNINLNQGKIYLQQDKDNSWLHLHLNNQKKSLPWGLDINVNEIKINNSDLFVNNNLDSENHTQVNITSANILFEENKNLFNLQGKIISGGEVNLTGFNTSTDNQWVLNIDAANIITETVNQINLVKLPLQIKSGRLNSNLSLEFKNETLNNIEGKINLNQVDVSFPPLAYTLSKTNGEILLNNEEIKLDNIQTNLGLIQANIKGVINQERELNINADMSQSLTIDDVITSLELPSINIETEGKIKGNIKVTGNVNKPIIQANITNAEKEITLDKIPVNEIKANLTIANSQVNIDDLTIKPQIGGEITGIGFVNLEKSNSKFNIDWQGKDIDGEKLLNLYQQTLPIPLGKINGNYNLSGDWQDFQNFQLTGVSNVTLPQGEARVKNLQLNADSWLAEIEVDKVGLKDLSFIDCEKLKCQDSLLDGEFNLQGKTHNLTQDSLKLTGNFSFNLEGNQVALEDTLIENNNWQTRLEVNNFPLPQLASFSDSQNSDNQGNNFLNLKGIDKGKITAGLTIKGDLQNNQDIKMEGEGKINLPQGEVKVTQVKVEKDNFIAKTVTDGFSLSQINNLSGEAKGDITIKGNLNSLSAESIDIDGNLLLTEGIGVISQPMKVSFGWNGKYLQLNQAVSNNLQARGVINLDTDTQQIKDIDLDVSTQQMSLSQLSLPSSLSLFNYQGDFNFQGKLTGNLSQPQLKGNVTLNQLKIANLNFSPLKGGLSFSPQRGLELTLNDNNGEDKFALKLDSQYQPLSLDLQTDTAKLIGLREADNFQINLYEIPLEKVTQSWQNYLPSEIKQVGGILSGEVNLNLDNYDITASSLTIKQPSLNHLRGDILTSELTMTDDVIEFMNGNLQHQKNEYQFAGELVSLRDNPQLQLAIEIKDGDIQNLLSSWEFFEFSDISQGFQPRIYASAKDLYFMTGEEKQEVSPLNPPLIRGGGNKQGSISINSRENQVNDTPENENHSLSLISEKQTSITGEEKQEVSPLNPPLVMKGSNKQESISINSRENQVNDTPENENNVSSLISEKQTSITGEGIRDNHEEKQEVSLFNPPLVSKEGNRQESVSLNSLENQVNDTSENENNVSSLISEKQTSITGEEKQEVSPFNPPLVSKEGNRQESVSLNSRENQVNDTPENENHSLSLISEKQTSITGDGIGDDDKNKQEISPLNPPLVRGGGNKQESLSLNSRDNQVNDTSENENHSLSLISEKQTSITGEDNQEISPLNPPVREGGNKLESLSLNSRDNQVNDTPEKQISTLESNNSVSHSLPSLFVINSDSNSLLETIDILEGVKKNLRLKQEKDINGNLPSLEDLKGNINGIINLRFSSQNGVKAEFDLNGDSWQWGKYDGDFLQVTGSYHNKLLTFLPIVIQSDNTILSLTGTFQPEKISGEVTLSNFPLSHLASIANLPDSLDIKGSVNTSIAISGSEENPLAKGNIEVVNAQINDNNIDKTNASFGLRNSRIDFLANSNLTNNQQSLQLIASLPFRVFPNSLKPQHEDFKLDINLNKDGFSLLNIITNNQLNWLAGDGNIDLIIEGKYIQDTNTIQQLNTEGILTVNNGIIQGKLLDNQLISNINGQVFFDFSQLNIPSLTGDFSGSNILLSGSLPLVNTSSKDNLLTLNIDNLALNINSFYQGNASANLNISGSAIAPSLGGVINLHDGKIELKNQNPSQLSFAKNNLLNDIKIDNLSLILQDNVTIDQAPILNIKAQGEINLSGSLNRLNPEGIINLKGGTINLFTSQLSLVNSYKNTAKFMPENGFNPYLDLRLESSVTETSRYQFVDTSNPNEIRDFSDFSINTAQTIRVKAEVKGWSNNLENNITLSSSPQRNETEIIALLGGGFFNNLTEGNGNIDLANLASAAFLGGVQGEIQKTLGFDELRLFPTQILDTENRTSTLGLGAELALDLSDNFSVSVMKILTNEQAPRYSIRYRLNEQTIFRGSSDFEQDTRGVLEFEHRF